MLPFLGNGLVERQNRHSLSCMLKVLDGKSKDWPKALNGVLMAQRTTVHRSTNVTPLFLVYGRQPRLPIHVEISQNMQPSGDDNDELTLRAFQEYATKFQQVREATAAAVSNNICAAPARQKQSSDKRHQIKRCHSVGRNIWLKILI